MVAFCRTGLFFYRGSLFSVICLLFLMSALYIVSYFYKLVAHMSLVAVLLSS